MSRAHELISSTHELVQVLHHAMVYSLNLVLLIICDKRTILRGIWIKFDEEVVKKYEMFLANIYYHTFQWAYDITKTIAETREEVQDCLPKQCDMEGYLEYYGIWKEMFKPGNYLPIPPTLKIVPYHFSKWNK